MQVDVMKLLMACTRENPETGEEYNFCPGCTATGWSIAAMDHAPGCEYAAALANLTAPETKCERNYLYFDTGGGKPVSWLRRILERIGFVSPQAGQGIPDDAVITKATLVIYTQEASDD